MIIRYNHESQAPGMNEISKISKHIILTRKENVENLNMIKNYNIKNILYVGDTNIIKKTKNKNVKYYNIRLENNNWTNIDNFFTETYNIIRKSTLNNDIICVCCDDGVNISAMVVINYFLTRYYYLFYKSEFYIDLIDKEISFIVDILKFTKEFRPCSSPSDKNLFNLLKKEMQLKIYFRKLLIKEAEECFENNPIEDSEEEDEDNLYNTEINELKLIKRYIKHINIK